MEYGRHQDKVGLTVNLFSTLLPTFQSGIATMLNLYGTDIVRYRPAYKDVNGTHIGATVVTIRAMIGGNAYAYSMQYAPSAMLNIGEKDEKDIVICHADADLRETDYLIQQGMSYGMTNVKLNPFGNGVVALVGFKLRTGQNFDWSVLPNQPDDDILLLGNSRNYNL